MTVEDGAKEGMEARLIRTVRFHASHHYRRPDWSEAENRRVFGPQSEPHGHLWRVEVHLAGAVDPATGWCVDLGALDAALAGIVGGWDGGDINRLVPDVADGTMTPSTENLARWIHRALSASLRQGSAGVESDVAALGGGRPSPRLLEVRVFESDDLGSGFPVA